MEICKGIVMAKYIDKDALVAEIERRMKEITKEYQESKTIQYTLIGKINALENLLPFINTLEVKEVDLESLVKDFCYEYDDRKEKWYELCPNGKKLLYNPTWANFAMSIAKHFFELGLKTQKGVNQ
jgi:hypothetical protein